ncbi:hypothetical protein Tco_0644013 [Tanacetum coccineum]
MTTFAEHIIIAGAENRPPMLEKSVYDSWVSRIRLFIKGKKHGRMMLDSNDNDDCDVQATNIILCGLPPDVYPLVNHQEAAKDFGIDLCSIHSSSAPSYSSQSTTISSFPSTIREYPIECINKAMEFLSAVASRFPPLNNQLRTSSNPRNQETIQDAGQPRVVKGHMVRQCTQPKRPRNDAWFKEKLMLAEAQEAGQILDEEQLAFLADPGISEAPVAQQTIPQNLAFQTEDLDVYDSDCDDLSSAKAVLMANLSSCDPEVLSNVPYFDSYPNDMINQDVQEMQYSEQTHVDDFQDNEIHSEHVVIYVIHDEETLILEKESRSKMLDQQNDPVSIEKKIKISPIDYSKLNKIKENFGKCFVTQKELSAEQPFWLKHSSLSETPVTSHTLVRIEAPSELPKCSVDKNVFEIQIKQLRIDNDQLLNQIMSQEIVHIVTNSVDILDLKKLCVNNCNKCLELETKLFKKKYFIEKEAYDKLVKSYSNLEKHCISLKLATQLNQEIFQRENSGENLNAPTFNQLFEINELKAQSQEKDTVIRKLKERIKSLSGKDSVENVKKDIDEIETINIEPEHSVAKLLSENENLRKEREHLKSIFKDQFDLIGKTCVQSKEHCDSLITQINAKSVENSDLNAQLQENVFAITALKNDVNTVVSKPTATLALRMFKLDIEPISPRLKNNRDAHEVYIEKTIEYADTLRGFVKHARTQYPSEPLLESTCMFTKHVQELLVYASQTCPNSPEPNEKLVAITPINKGKKDIFAERVTSSNNIPKQTDSLKTKDSNKPLLTSTGVKPTTSASGSKPSGNTKNNRITRPPRSN